MPPTKFSLHLGQSILFITPPFTQLNTPYPATAVLKGFMNCRNILSYQCDLGMEVILALFSSRELNDLFRRIDERPGTYPGLRAGKLSENTKRMVQLKEKYMQTIGPVMNFLQGHNPEIAHLVCGRHWLPEAGRFSQTTDLDHDFGHLGIQDRAKYLATLYLEDISDFITETVDPHFGFSRYAERLGRSASNFDELEQELNRPDGLIDRTMMEILNEKITQHPPSLVALSVPFPGNLYGALKCGQWLRKNHPEIKIAMGGGYVNTELRSLTDCRVFDYIDFITLDDGEVPLLCLTEYLDEQRKQEDLKRTFLLIGGVLHFINGSKEPDADPNDTGIPDYSDLPLDKYLSVIEVANPMHRLWSDGRWNKLMLAHGCYWGKCTFCDITLDYIKRYAPCKPEIICDRMEAIMAQTGRPGFHFTDEAAPPALLRDLALEILRRKLNVIWWTNIRFEKTFSRDLCHLLKESGCIAVSGGLEVASDRILKMINKGVTVSQVAQVADNFSRAGIMVHAYLMYGFPTQTDRETIDSLEVVRQLFLHGAIKSGFWHQFAMTAHSPVGMDPARFGVDKEDTAPGAFANNDLIPIDRKGCDHASFSRGLKKSLYNYMHGICLDFPLQEWFDFRIPRTTIAPDFIWNIVSREPQYQPAPHARIIWPGSMPQVTFYVRQKKGKSMGAARLTIQTQKQEVTLLTSEIIGNWLMRIFPQLIPGDHDPITFDRMKELFMADGMGDFKAFWEGTVIKRLRENGLLIV